MTEIVKALNGINATLITLQQNIHIDLVEVKEEMKKANKNSEKYFEYVNKYDEMLAKNLQEIQDKLKRYAEGVNY